MVEWIEIRIYLKQNREQIVSTLVVEWIEITSRLCRPDQGVSTLVVEWIEIYRNAGAGHPGGVSTLVVEWIEI